MNRLEASMKQMIAQIEQLKHDNRGMDSGLRGEMGTGPGQAKARPGGEGISPGARDRPGWGNEGPYGSRRPFDIGRVKCFRCDKLGHFVRECPNLPNRGSVNKDKKDLNE